MDWFVIWRYYEDLERGLMLTIELSAASILVSSLIGVGVGVMRSSPSFFARKFSNAYAEIFRNTPIVVKLFFLHFVVNLDAISAGFWTLVLHATPYISDYTLAGFRTIPIGQMEASRSSGLTYLQTFRYVLFPQAIRPMIPPMTIQYIQTVKDSSIVSIIAVVDVMYVTTLINDDTFRAVETALTSTGIYLVLVSIVVVIMTLLQRLAARRIPS